MPTKTRPTLSPFVAERQASPLAVRRTDAVQPTLAPPPLTDYLREFALPASLKLWQRASDNLCQLIRMQATIHAAARECSQHFILLTTEAWQLSLSGPGSARWRAALRESRRAPAPAESPT